MAPTRGELRDGDDVVEIWIESAVTLGLPCPPRFRRRSFIAGVDAATFNELDAQRSELRHRP
jgi:hypothetical protein